jgi:CRP/FNR family transcriptional regulator, dissimilatory nitrate respiration regulator
MNASISELKRTGLSATLRNCRLFANLRSPDLEAIASLVRIKTLARGDYLFREGGPSQGFYVVQKGAVNVHRITASGKEQVIQVFRAGESFAEASLAMDSGYPADARAVEPSQVLLIEKAGFLGLVRRQPELALRMLAAMSVHLRDLLRKLEDLTLRDVETRLANWLVKRSPDGESPNPFMVELRTTKRVLASELGTVSETFSRTLARFRDQGWISVKGRRLTVHNPGALRDLLRRNLGE